MSLKVAIVSPFPEQKGTITGGVAGVTHCLITGLHAVSELEIHVVAPCRNRRRAGVEHRNGDTVHWLYKPKPNFLCYWTIFRQAVYRCLAEIRPDVTHFQGIGGWTLGYKEPYVFTIHGIAERDMLFAGGPLSWIRRTMISWVERISRRRARHTIVISPYIIKEVGEQIGGTCWDIENPVTREFFEIHRRPQSSRILYVGRISKRKNILGLLSVFAKVLKKVPSAKLRIAGLAEDQAYFDKCRNFIDQNQLNNTVRFLGNVDRKKLLSELAGASCLALFSQQETAPMVVGEAMSAGVPVVASRVCGLPYMIEEGQTGFLIDPLDELAFAEKLRKLLDNPVTADRMGKNARSIAQLRFDARIVAEKTLTAYHMAISEGK